MNNDKDLPPAGDVEFDKMAHEHVLAVCRGAAASCLEQHAYMQGAKDDSKNWFPHKWVIDAMRALIGINQSTCFDLRSEVTRLTSERDGLLAEVARWKALAANQADRTEVATDIAKECKSDLTKARERAANLESVLLEVRGCLERPDVRQHGWEDRCLDQVYAAVPSTPIACNVDESGGQDAEAAKTVFNDPLYNAESDARNAAAMLEEVLEFYDDGIGRSTEEFQLMRKIGDWLGRSVPEIEHGSDDCAHSESNKIGCPECGEVFKP